MKKKDICINHLKGSFILLTPPPPHKKKLVYVRNMGLVFKYRRLDYKYM